MFPLIKDFFCLRSAGARGLRALLGAAAAVVASGALTGLGLPAEYALGVGAAMGVLGGLVTDQSSNRAMIDSSKASEGGV